MEHCSSGGRSIFFPRIFITLGACPWLGDGVKEDTSFSAIEYWYVQYTYASKNRKVLCSTIFSSPIWLISPFRVAPLHTLHGRVMNEPPSPHLLQQLMMSLALVPSEVGKRKNKCIGENKSKQLSNQVMGHFALFSGWCNSLSGLLIFFFVEVLHLTGFPNPQRS